jgi:hypothetical protein
LRKEKPMNYEALDDQALQNLARARFGNVLKPLKEIGRGAIIKELKAYDRFLEYKEKKGGDKERYEYRDFVTGEKRYTRGQFEKWSEPTGPLDIRYAIFKCRRSRVCIPYYLLTPETKTRIPLPKTEKEE